MEYEDLLAKSAWLLEEFMCQTHALPMRLRVLNMFTYTLDTLYMHAIPPLVQAAAADREAAARLRWIADESVRMLNEANDALRLELRPELEAYGIRVMSVEECSRAEQEWLADYFARSVRPLLTPLAVDAGRPFPQISAHSLNLLAVIEQGSSFDIAMPSFARLKIPRLVPRLVEIGDTDALENDSRGIGPEAGEPPSSSSERRMVLSEDLVRAHVRTLFPGLTVVGVYQFRILRGSAVDSGVPVGRHTALARQKAWPVVRIDVEQGIPEWVVRWLQENLESPLAVVLERFAPLGMGSLAAEWAERLPLLREELGHVVNPPAEMAQSEAARAKTVRPAADFADQQVADV